MEILKKYRLCSHHILFMLMIALLGNSCKKTIIGDDPYAGGKAKLGIEFDNTLPSPETASQGEEVNVNVKGLKKFEDKFAFYVNETKATVVNLTDSTITIKVPENASSGGLSVIIDGQTFFGPILKIDGKVMLEQSYKAMVGSNGSIEDGLRLPSGNFLLTGTFSNFDNKATDKMPIGGIVQINSQGEYATTLNFGKGANATINSALRLNDGKFLIGGFFQSFNSTRTKRANIRNLTMLNADGTLDTTIIDVVNATTNPLKNRDTVPTFNGGVDGQILKVFNFNDRIYLIGNFQNYQRAFYERSSYDATVYDLTKMKQMVALKIDGSMDSTFHFNKDKKESATAGNGAIRDAIMLPNGNMIIVGAFTTFNGVPANRIVCIRPDGTIDNTFNPGTGADNDIIKITYNQTTKKMLLAGNFATFNGISSKGVIMINEDGSVNNAFAFASIGSGSANFAGQLDNGKILVSGNFKAYNGVIRQGFMILDPDGKLASGYNNTGVFQGRIAKMIETTSALGNPAVILIGSIARFDNMPVNNIVRVEIKN